MTSITTQLVAQVSITDVGIVVDPFGWVWQVMQPQYVCDLAYTDTTVYNKRGEHNTYNGLSAAVNLYPNPVERGGDLVVEGLTEGDFQLVLTLLDGRMVKTGKVSVSEGASLKVGVPTNATPGIYIFTATIDSQTLTFKIMVL